MKYFAVLVLAMVTLSGCDSIEDMKGMLDKQEDAQTIVKDRYGLQSKIGFNITNGRLQNVTLMFGVEDVRGYDVATLDEISQTVVNEVFKSKPKSITIQISSFPNE